ncbi:hypothetical protein OROGR_025721 [Orobanche gracilis]
MGVRNLCYFSLSYRPLADVATGDNGVRLRFRLGHICLHLSDIIPLSNYFPSSFSSRRASLPTVFKNRIQNLPKLVEDVVQTSISTGPRRALRLAQGIQQSLVLVASGWLMLPRPENSSSGLATKLQLGLLSPLYLRKLFERMGATYIKLGQVHGAMLRGTQEDVVIEVLKSGIEDILVADLNFVYTVARILEFLSPDISRTSLGCYIF